MFDATLEVTVGGAVTFTYRVRNESDGDVTISFPTSQRAEFEVYEADELVWRWSDGRTFAQVLGEETLAPGESLTAEAAWTDSGSGCYTALASLASDDADAEARVAFEV